tara:strand:- start:210 stop:1919 length:1710 start_codon:yes stop_codon:yes gene_type:complete
MKEFFRKFNNIFSKKEKIYFLLYLLLTLVVPLFEVVSLGSIVGLIYFILEKEKFLIFLNNYNLNFLSNIEDSNFGVLIVLTIGLAFIFKNSVLLFYAYVESKFRNKLVAEKSSKLFKNFIQLNYLKFRDYKKSELFNNIMLEVARVIDYFFSLLIIFREVFIIILLIVSLLFFDVFYTFSILVFLLGFTLILYFLLKKKLFKIGEKLIIFQERLLNLINEVSDLFKIIIFGKKQNFFINHFIKLNNERAQNIFYQQYIKKLPRIIFEVYIILIICFFLLYKINLETDLKTLIPFLSLLVLIAVRLLPAFSNLNISFTTLKFSEASFENYLHNLELSKLHKADNETGDKKDIIFKNNINFIKIENVTFSYNNKIKLLNNVSFEIKKGEIFGIFGKSGSGKSTLVDIISGLIKPDIGNIKINNDLNININLSSWQNQIGYVTQNPVLINDTIRNNISLGDLETDEKKLSNAINFSGLDQIIKNLPQKSDTIVGELGSKFSGGQKQMIAIARAVYRDPKLFIFDEATSAIDKEAENKIIEKIKELEKDNLVVIISHDNKLKSFCNNFINLDG